MVVKRGLEWVPCLDVVGTAFPTPSSTARRRRPPRPAGALTLLDAAPQANVAILGHVGLEHLSSMSSLARSLPLATPVRARVWRVARSEVPRDRVESVEWLWRRWEALDDWVDATLAPRPATAGAET